MTTFKPMLAATVTDVAALRFPLMASPKLDGVRALVRGGQLVSRNLKLIPNRATQAIFAKPALDGLDGELIVGPATAPDAFRRTSSGVMSIEGEPDVNYYVFDHVAVPSGSFRARASAVTRLARLDARIQVVPQLLVTKLAEVERAEETFLAEGYEGLMLRDPAAPYKFGRSTFREHGLMKLKRFDDAEAVVIGFEELMHNSNEATTDHLGAKTRSSKRAGMIGRGTLGALRVVGANGAYHGVEFSIGTGFDAATRADIWTHRARWQGLAVKYKFFPSGSKEAPRFPVFLGARHDPT